MVSHQGGLSSGQSVIRVVSHQGGLLSVISCYQGGLSSGWSVIRVVSHQGSLSSGWSVVWVVKGVVSSGWCFIGAVHHQGGVLSGRSSKWSLVKGSIIMQWNPHREIALKIKQECSSKEGLSWVNGWLTWRCDGKGFRKIVSKKGVGGLLAGCMVSVSLWVTLQLFHYRLQCGSVS